MIIPMHKVFISYHHANDKYYKNQLVQSMDGYAFRDTSVDTGDINENLPADSIRTIIRDDYLKDSSVTIVLVGTETKNRKHVDWEIYSSMYNGAKNKKSGILVVNLPTIANPYMVSICEDDWAILGRDSSWGPITNYDNYSYLPTRLVDNIKSPSAHICVVNYMNIIGNPDGLKKLIDIAYNKRETNTYDLSRPMRERNG